MSTPNPEIHIRPATRHDLPYLEWGGTYWKYRNLFQRAYQEQRRGRRLMLLAVTNERPIGQAFIQFRAGQSRYVDGHTRGYLYSVRVMPAFRRRGIGTRLLAAAEGELVARGYSVATIAVAKTNEDAQRLYRRLGYRVFGEDAGRWSFRDPDGRIHRVAEPCYGMEKQLRLEG